MWWFRVGLLLHQGEKGTLNLPLKTPSPGEVNILQGSRLKSEWRGVAKAEVVHRHTRQRRMLPLDDLGTHGPHRSVPLVSKGTGTIFLFSTLLLVVKTQIIEKCASSNSR